MSFSAQGFEILPNIIQPNTSVEIIEETHTELIKLKGGGIRNADKKFKSISSLIHSHTLLEHVARYLKGQPYVVRAILFDKTKNNNWLVAWHQDKTVAVSATFFRQDWKAWSIKDKTHHVQPPIDVLNSMITLRISLDDSTIENGCLKIIPRSHKQGVLTETEIHETVNYSRHINIELKALSAIAMRPHLLHASSKATHPTRRRVLHLEYSDYRLPDGVFWA